MRLFLLVCFMVISGAGLAQDRLRGFAPLKMDLYEAGTLLMGEDDPDAPVTQDALLKIYEDHCLRANSNPALHGYNETQCACTASEMSISMNAQQMRRMFDESPEGNFEYARMLLMAYVPCLQQTMHDFVLDECLRSKKLLKQGEVCSCVGKNMEEFLARRGHHLVPGFKETGFDKKNSVNDILGYALSSDSFQRKSEHLTKVCIRLSEIE